MRSAFTRLRRQIASLGIVLVVISIASVSCDDSPTKPITKPPTSKTTWYILPDGSGDAPTVQAGIDSAAVGDTVLVAPGTYTDTTRVAIEGVLVPVNVFIDKNIRVVAEGNPANTIIDGSPYLGIAVYFTNVDSTSEISGFGIKTTAAAYFCAAISTFSVNQLPVTLDVGIRCDSASPVIIGNEIVEHRAAVQLNNSPAIIRNNVIGTATFGVTCRKSDAELSKNTISNCALLVDSDSSSVTIIGNSLSVSCEAISCNVNLGTEISGNLVFSNPIGIMGGRSSLLIKNNTFFGNDLAINISQSSQSCSTMVTGNFFYANGSGAVGLSGNPNAVILITNNTIDVGGYGISCQGLSSPTINNNIMTRLNTGVICITQSQPTFSCNNIFDVSSPYFGDCTDQNGVNGNISVDPKFCDIDDDADHSLQSDSPCAVGNHPNGDSCGLIGAFGVNCITSSP